MGDRLRDFRQVSKKALIETLSKFKKMYIAFIFIVLRTIFENIRLGAIFGGNMLAGLIEYLIEILILAYLLQALRSVVLYGNTGKKSLENSVGIFWSPLISSFFYVYLIEMMVQMLTYPISKGVFIFFMAALRFLLSALLEEIYINGRSGMTAVKESAQFVCDNILTYGIYSLVYVWIEFYMSYNYSISLSNIDINNFGMVLLLSLITSFFYLFKGNLFKELNDHSYRQRKFMRG